MNCWRCGCAVPRRIGHPPSARRALFCSETCFLAAIAEGTAGDPSMADVSSRTVEALDLLVIEEAERILRIACEGCP